MKTLGYLLSALVAVLLAGALVGGAASLVWLLVLGEWRLVGLGIGAALAVVALAPLVLLPARVLAGWARRGTHGSFLPVLADGWAAVVLAGALLASLRLLYQAPDPEHRLPAAVWSYAAATLPWIWLAYRQDRETGGEAGGAALLAVLGQAAYVAGLLSHHYARLDAVELGGVMLVVVGLGAVAGTARGRPAVPSGAAGPSSDGGAPDRGEG